MNPRMLSALAFGLIALSVAAVFSVSADEPAPLWPRDLVREADKAGPTVAEALRRLAIPADELTLTDGSRVHVEPQSEYLQPGAATPAWTLRDADGKTIQVVGSDLKGVRYYEENVSEAVAGFLKAENSVDGAWAAEKALRAGLRFSRSRRQAPMAGASRWAAGQDRLAEQLVDVRRRLLQLLSARADRAEALRWADVWLPLYPPESSLNDDIRTLWIREATGLAKTDAPQRARAWLDRIDAVFWHSPQADALRTELRGRAQSLLDASNELPDGKAVATLQEALTLWPRLPGLRDVLEKRRHTYQVLYVAVPDLPEYLSPALAWSDGERQAMQLIFEGLVQARHDAALGTHYRPVLAERLPAGTGVRRPLVLRRDVYWANGERFTAADIRHTVQLPGHAEAWRDLMESPRLEGNPFGLEIVYRAGLLDPWAPLQLKVLPQNVRGHALARADDADFARQPVGTGPYQWAGKESAAGRVYLVLRANPNYVRPGRRVPESIREIRFFQWKGGEPPPGQPAPHLVLDASRTASPKLPVANLHHLPVPRVWYLGMNHRRAAFANVHVRLALAQAIDRQGLLDRHFRTALPASLAVSVNGVFPRDSWANSPATLVPEELYRPEEARSSARRAGKELGAATWTLKYPVGDPRLDAAFKELAEQVRKVLAGADAPVTIQPVPLAPRPLQEAVRQRDFDLVYLPMDLTTDPAGLAAAFDPREEALKPGGSNFLGYAHDPRLRDLLRSALHHRDFRDVKRAMQGVHQQLYVNMPVIPLWQLPYSVAVSPRLRTPELDPLAIFGNVLEWKLTP